MRLALIPSPTCLDSVSFIMPTTYREPLCLHPVLPSVVCCPATHQQALPRLHRSYGLMRQSKNPPPDFVLYRWSLQVIANPCWKLDLPDVISTILVLSLGPLPRSVPMVLFPVSSHRTSASHLRRRARHTEFPSPYNFHDACITGLQSFHYVQAPILARLPGCTYR